MLYWRTRGESRSPALGRKDTVDAQLGCRIQTDGLVASLGAGHSCRHAWLIIYYVTNHQSPHSSLSYTFRREIWIQNKSLFLQKLLVKYGGILHKFKTTVYFTNLTKPLNLYNVHFSFLLFFCYKSLNIIPSFLFSFFLFRSRDKVKHLFTQLVNLSND